MASSHTHTDSYQGPENPTRADSFLTPVDNYDLKGFYCAGAEKQEIRKQELATGKSAKEEALRWFLEDLCPKCHYVIICVQDGVKHNHDEGENRKRKRKDQTQC